MPKLNKAQEYAIRWLAHTGKSHDTIAKELNISQKQVEKILDVKEVVAEQTFVQNNISTKDHMITHTSGKKINSVAIMTKEASEIADSAKKSVKAKSYGSDNEKGIFRPKKR